MSVHQRKVSSTIWYFFFTTESTVHKDLGFISHPPFGEQLGEIFTTESMVCASSSNLPEGSIKHPSQVGTEITKKIIQKIGIMKTQHSSSVELRRVVQLVHIFKSSVIEPPLYH